MTEEAKQTPDQIQPQAKPGGDRRKVEQPDNISLNVTPEPQTPEKVTLHAFVEANYKLITCMAAFIALTGFASQLNDAEAKTTIAGFALLAAGLFAMELFFSIPLDNRHWRVWLLQMIMLGLVLEIGRYFFFHFPAVWGPVAQGILGILIFGGPPIAFVFVTDWVLRVRTKVNERARARIGLAVFAGSFLLLFVLVQVRLHSHPISIQIPKRIMGAFPPK